MPGVTGERAGGWDDSTAGDPCGGKEPVRPRHLSFSPKQLITEVERNGTRYSEETLRSHIVSAMCVDAPQHNPSYRNSGGSATACTSCSTMRVGRSHGERAGARVGRGKWSSGQRRWRSCPVVRGRGKATFSRSSSSISPVTGGRSSTLQTRLRVSSAASVVDVHANGVADVAAVAYCSRCSRRSHVGGTVQLGC